MLFAQPSLPFWRRHPVLTAAVILCGGWLLINGWLLTVTVVATVALAIGLRRRHRAQKIRRAGLTARADLEHRFAMTGDPRGIYGRFPPVRAGWFPDPFPQAADRGRLRYFDGAAWSGYTLAR